MFALPDIADSVARGIVLGAFGLAFIILIVRIVGLRSFSKMTAFDFVITLATGSLLASAGTVSSWASYVQALFAIATLMGLQVALAVWRRRQGGTSSPIENAPVVLMRDGVFIEETLRRTRVSPDDIRAKLRGANVLSLSEVLLVVLETTGDISVLKGERIEDDLLLDVHAE